MADTRGFEIGLRVVLGNFAFQKMAMVKDLQERANDLPVHDVIAAIAGDSKAKSAINAEQTDPDPREFDRIPPDYESRFSSASTRAMVQNPLPRSGLSRVNDRFSAVLDHSLQFLAKSSYRRQREQCDLSY
jgi:hypothetical protein